MKSVELIVDGTRMEFREDLILKHPGSDDRLGRCLPKEMERGSFYKFSLDGYNIFPIGKAISLFEKGVRNPVASISIMESTVFLLGGSIDTHGEYVVRVCSRGYKKRMEGVLL